MGEQAKDTGPEFSQQAGGSGTGRLTSRAERPGKTIIDLKSRWPGPLQRGVRRTTSATGT